MPLSASRMGWVGPGHRSVRQGCRRAGAAGADPALRGCAPVVRRPDWRWWRPAGRPSAAEFGHQRVRADAHRNAAVFAGDPGLRARASGQDPCWRRASWPVPRAGGRRAAPAGAPSLPAAPARPRPDHAFLDRSLLQPQHHVHCRFLRGITAQAPDRFGRVGDHAAGAERGDSRVRVSSFMAATGPAWASIIPCCVQKGWSARTVGADRWSAHLALIHAWRGSTSSQRPS